MSAWIHQHFHGINIVTALKNDEKLFRFYKLDSRKGQNAHVVIIYANFVKRVNFQKCCSLSMATVCSFNAMFLSTNVCKTQTFQGPVLPS